MRKFVGTSLAVLMLACAANAGASGWRDLRIDASSESRFTEPLPQMRDELPYHRALLFVLVLKDLKSRFAPADYRQQLDGLTYKQIAHLASPNVTAEYLAHYAGRPVAQPISPGDTTGPSPFTGVANPFGAFPGFDQTTGRQLLAP